MTQLKSTLIVLLLACMLLAAAMLLLAGVADGRADFAKWANRSSRVLEPANYNTSGTASYAICDWKGVRGTGNAGIGDGNISLMKPEVLHDLVRSSTTAGGITNETASTGNETTREGNQTTGNEAAAPGNSTDVAIRAPDSNQPGNGTLAIQNQVPQPEEPETEDEAKDEGPVTESLYPDYVLAASVIPRLAPYSITVNKPFEHILAEQPCEAAALYGKLIGLPMPSGQVIDLGIKSIGYEY